jgi:hypothetical protein
MIHELVSAPRKDDPTVFDHIAIVGYFEGSRSILLH